MDAVLIIAPYDYDKEIERRLGAHWAVSRRADGGMTIDEHARGRIYIFRDASVLEDIELNQLDQIKALIAVPVFYTVDFSDIALCRQVLLAVADDPQLVVDNDHGVLLPGPQFVRQLHSRPNWDWRNED